MAEAGGSVKRCRMGFQAKDGRWVQCYGIAGHSHQHVVAYQWWEPMPLRAPDNEDNLWTNSITEPPVRLCCYQRHYGAICPDGKVMCCLCFDRFDPADLATDANDDKEDVCVPCANAESAEMARRAQSGRSDG